jgi:hypothetical protein
MKSIIGQTNSFTNWLNVLQRPSVLTKLNRVQPPTGVETDLSVPSKQFSY